MAAEQLKNFGYALLASTIDGVTDPVTFNVTAGYGARFPSSGNFRLTIRPAAAVESDVGEILLVTSRSTDSLTASRAQEGTTITSHAIGDVCRHVPTAGGMRQLLNDYSGFGAVASRPAAGFAGRVYKPTNSGVSYLDDGTRWLTIHKDTLLSYGPITASGFTNTNFQSGTTVTQVGDTVRLNSQGQGADQHQYILKSLANTTTYTLTCALELGGNLARANTYGYLGLRDSANGKFISFGIDDDGTTYFLSALKYTGDTDTGTGIVTKKLGPVNSFITLKITMAAGTITLNYSFDNTNFVQLASFSRSTYLDNAPNGYMLAIDPTFAGDTFAAQANFLSFTEA